MTTAAAERQKTMQLRALRRLSECEVAGLGVALAELDRLEATLVAVLPTYRAAADRERRARAARGLPPNGDAVRAWSAVRLTLHAVSEARDETTAVEAAGKVPRRRRGAA